MTLKHNAQTKNNSKNSNQNSCIESANFVTSKMFKSEITIECRRCNQKFYFNNKLHKHLRTECRFQTFSRKIQKVSIHLTRPFIRIIEFENKQKNYQNFAFRKHHYATVKRSLIENDSIHDFCMNSGTFMFFVDKNFLAKQKSNQTVHKTISSIKIRGIGSKIHDNSKICNGETVRIKKIQKNINNRKIEYRVTHSRKPQSQCVNKNECNEIKMHRYEFRKENFEYINLSEHGSIIDDQTQKNID